MKQSVFGEGRDSSFQSHRERLTSAEAKHRELDARLKELGRFTYLTPSEQVEASEIKKRKLLAKDEIDSLRRLLS